MSKHALPRIFPQPELPHSPLTLPRLVSTASKQICAHCQICGRRYAGSAAATAAKSTPGPQELYHGQARQKQTDREFFADLLSSAATKRDARAYIARLKSVAGSKPSTPLRERLPLGLTTSSNSKLDAQTLFGRSRAVEASPMFYQGDHVHSAADRHLGRIHVALIKLSAVEQIPEPRLEGIAQTFTQLARLSMAPVVVLDCGPFQGDLQQWKRSAANQACRLVSALDKISKSGARRVDDIFSLSSEGQTLLALRNLIIRPLHSAKVPVILPLAYSNASQQAVPVSADAAVLALSAGLVQTQDSKLPEQATEPAELSLDRIIIIDPSGPIPSTKGQEATHVFVNMEQEYHSLQEELRSSSDANVSPRHATNLTMLRRALQMLPPTASGLITTPEEAANMTSTTKSESVSNVGTRRQKNPLIHNLLTDKPAYSSSLPSGRLVANTHATSGSTFVKRGMPLTILPNPAAQEWTAEKQPWVKLTDPRIDLERLTYLINDSFDRKLDVGAYLERVNDRLAGVIIAGEYEGGAILTWETPPGADEGDTKRLVPYLDKFAVLKTSQGAGGVADILFNAMVRTCFPKGVCWRSRKDNPVNKWYFERSSGTWKIPESNWTMFWTTPGVEEKGQTFLDYEAVCRGVQPTWLDNKSIPD